MATEFDTGLPSFRQVQMLIRDRQTIEVKLTTGDVLIGNIIWQDQHVICLETEGQSLMLMRGAVAYLKMGM
ncbi:MAG: RNA-binding protein hfq [Leptolyngbya sp. SIO4C1]|nr:RNA-binding protein hfq [Leptolyngbya sp. SIO4C1]